jgi:hypothetical protein
MRGLLKQAKAPAVLWSGGPRSTEVLRQAREIDGGILVIWFYAGLTKEEKSCCESLIMEWDLNVYSWHPSEVYYTNHGLRLDYPFGSDRFSVWLQGERLIPERRTKNLFPEFDLLLTGREVVRRLGNAEVISPMRKAA